MLRTAVRVLIVLALSCASRVVDADPVAYRLDLLYYEGDTVHGRTLRGLGYRPAVNDSGEVAAVGYAEGSGAFVFTSAGVVAEAGQTLDGKKLVQISGRVEMNNAGQIAFSAQAEGD